MTKLKIVTLSIIPLLLFMLGLLLLPGQPVDAYVERGITFHAGATTAASGNVLNTTGLATVAVQVTNGSTQTVIFEGTVNGSTWVSIQGMNMNDGTVTTTVTANSLYVVPVSGLTLFRCSTSIDDTDPITVTGMGTDLVFQRVSVS
jgi:hypothetical protein